MTKDTTVLLDEFDASWLSTLLFCLADLVNPDEREAPLALSDSQLAVLTDPAASAISRDRPQFANRLRMLADRIEGELGPGAPQVRPSRSRR